MIWSVTDHNAKTKVVDFNSTHTALIQSIGEIMNERITLDDEEKMALHLGERDRTIVYAPLKK